MITSQLVRTSTMPFNYFPASSHPHHHFPASSWLLRSWFAAPSRLLMSFIGSIGVLIEGTGLQDLLIRYWAGKIPTQHACSSFSDGRNPLTSIRTWSYNKDGWITWSTAGTIKQGHDCISNRSTTAKVWVALFIMPVITMKQYKIYWGVQEYATLKY